MKRTLLLLALAATLALPFWLRPARDAGLAAASADDTVVIISPHNEAIRHEFGLAFARWYRARTGRTVAVDWRSIGGTSEIARYLEGEYNTSFQNLWTGRFGQTWSTEVQAGFTNPKAPAGTPAAAARAAFLASDAGCGLDLMFGGGSFDFKAQAAAGRLVDCGLLQAHPGWFTDAVIPPAFAGEDYWDPQGRWIGCALSAFGLVFNRDEVARRGLPGPPVQWADLADPRYLGGVALADPTKSGSIAKAFENLIQQQMQARLTELTAAGAAGAAGKNSEVRAVNEGWVTGLRMLQLISANARYFTDSSQKVPIDVAAGDCAAGMCIDSYGRQQAEAVMRRAGSDRAVYVSPVGGTVCSADPIGLLRGAPHRTVALAFIEFALSPEGQALWNLRPGTPGGPEQYALRRLPIRKDFYADVALKPYRSDPAENPYATASPLTYHSAWTGGVFRELSFIIKVVDIDPHPELVEAWRAILAAGRPTAAMAVLQDLSAVDYAAANGRIHAALAAKDPAEQIRLAAELGAAFRMQYRRAAEVARAR
jgi:ABC-type Fe3+ transport system substrate-binding protein